MPGHWDPIPEQINQIGRFPSANGSTYLMGLSETPSGGSIVYPR